MFENLFSPIKIRGLELRNRVVYPGMGTKMAGKDSYVTDKIIDYQKERASGGSGLNYLEINSVDPASAPKGFLSLADDKYIPKLKELTSQVHEAGGKIGVQLWQGSIAVYSDPEAEIVVPSNMDFFGMEIKGITRERIEEIIVSYGEAARKAVDAGFDILEIHAAHNYSPHMFLSPAFNQRQDEFGGDYEGRTNYLFSIIKEVRKNIPEDMPLSMRIVAHDDYLENGLTIEDTIRYCRDAKELGLDILNVSRGNIVTRGRKFEVPPLDLDRGFNIENALRIKEETGLIVQGVGRVNNPKQADDIIGKGLDLITIGRGQLVDPKFCLKAKYGRVGDIVRCLGCNQGCYDGFVDPNMEHISCVRNPAVGREKDYAYKRTYYPKNIAIIGGGIAGLEAAYYLKDRGHNPTIFEKSSSLGGNMILAGRAHNKEEFSAAARFREGKLRKMQVDIRLESDFLEAEDRSRFDTAIIAIGASPKALDIEVEEGVRLIYGGELIESREKLSGRVLIIGGGIVGTEVADIIQPDVDSITILEASDQVGGKLGDLRRLAFLERLEGFDNLTIKTQVEPVKLRKDSVVYLDKGDEKELPYDYVVVAVGYESNDYTRLERHFKYNNINYFVIGDALEARGILEAFHEAIDTAIFDIE